MKKSLAFLAAITSLAASSAALANPIHSVWSQGAPFWFVAPGFPWQNPTVGEATFAWDESNPSAFASANITLVSGDIFEYKLVTVTASTLPGQITGDWDVYQNGVLVCGSCAGDAYGIDQPTGNYFKIYINSFTYHYSGFITARYDF